MQPATINWKLYIKETDELVWVGESNRLRTSLVMLWIVFCMIMACFLIGWCVAHFHDSSEICGKYPRSTCVTIFYFRWPIFVFYLTRTAMYAIEFLYVALGSVTRSYAITSSRALVVGYLWHRGQSIDLAQASVRMNWLGTIVFQIGKFPRRGFGKLPEMLFFVGLTDPDARHALHVARQLKGEVPA